MFQYVQLSFFFFFNDTATTEIYTLSLHDALPISVPRTALEWTAGRRRGEHRASRSEDLTSELQSRQYLVCRLLLEKKKQTQRRYRHRHSLDQLHYLCWTYRTR